MNFLLSSLMHIAFYFTISPLSTIHIPNAFAEDYVDAFISKNGCKCKITFTKPFLVMTPAFVAFACSGNFDNNSSVYQAIMEWRTAQQDYNSDSIKKTVVVDLPFQSLPHFSNRLLPDGGFINAYILLLGSTPIYQLTLVFKEKIDNAFHQEKAVSVDILCK